MSLFNVGLPNQPDKLIPAPTPSRPPTVLTSGTGTFSPNPATKWLKVTLIGGGGGGGSLGNSSPTGTAYPGLPGIPVTFWVQRTAASYAYTIGAGGGPVGGSNGNDGGNTTFGSLVAYGGRGGFGLTGGTGYTMGHAPALVNGYGLAGAPGAPGGNASGYGCGGGGAIVPNNSGGSGSGGLIIIEEY